MLTVPSIRRWMFAENFNCNRATMHYARHNIHNDGLKLVKRIVPSTTRLFVFRCACSTLRIVDVESHHYIRRR